MKTEEITQRWLDFFEKKGHTVVPSASLVSNDPSIMFTIAGMVPFIPYFLGEQKAPYKRATSIQKCIRTLDIDEVGKTARHGTFFQMAGNFSFGDYFKEQAIPFAWELLTTPVAEGGFGLEPDRLWVTIYETDDESFDIWTKTVGFPAERIQRMGMKDNYWSAGQPGGPAGPDSEIFYDRGPAYGKEGGPAADDDRYIEIWNLVFMQYERGEGIGKEDFEIRGELANKSIDTGLGVERLAMLLQGVENFYETDQVRAVLDKAAELAGKEYAGTEDPSDPRNADDVRMRVVSDHIRSSLMLIGDGVTPSNEGRGYVLRRLLRRAIRAMRLLGVDRPVVGELFDVSRDAMGGTYPQIVGDYERIRRVAVAEEKAFLRTIASGTARLDEAVSASKSSGGKISGADAFALHDTYGFPIDLTLEMAGEAGVEVDEAGFRSLMQEQRERAKADSQAKRLGGVDVSAYNALREAGETFFTGYTELATESTVRGILAGGQDASSAGAGSEIELVLEETPFYAEAGGQAADTGVITGDGFVVEVVDVQRPVKGLSVHKAIVREGEVSRGALANAQVDVARRRAGEQAHSATHIVHAALRQLLGDEATQRGSFNKAGYLRFDFAWSQQLSAATKSEIEDVANQAILGHHEVVTREMPIEEAKALGAMALFGENYGDMVRVVEIDGSWSRELCGGTHVANSSQIGSLTLLGEQSVGSGNRRVEAFVGYDSFKHQAAERALVQSLSEQFKAPANQLQDRITATLEKLKNAEKELARYRAEALQQRVPQLVAEARDVAGKRVVAASVGAVDSADDLKQLATAVRDKLGADASVVVLIGVANGRPVVVAMSNEAARGLGAKAGMLVKAATKVLGGGGGGKDDVAQGGGQDASKADEALAAVVSELGR
ncbi:alanine--tRNA ligase [Arthrobacter sp. UM1]|uniref:alanine--tRNA ligase n=1 Tax=Arthrobacter sp. UM1 TaxID=2766776 RepID=UPI001CF675D6|nr:alanine--tRNA ligase [Arthrobacter sp. UM1]MCB4207583.1 alanine--tRNA ligase [Arthrobacter sp. UM1]